MLTLETAPTRRSTALTHDEELELRQLRLLVHHDLRTPLTSIIGFAELLLEREMTPEKRRQLIGFIAREGARINALLNEVAPPER
jgi:two-component system sensor histidine kinase VicK